MWRVRFLAQSERFGHRFTAVGHHSYVQSDQKEARPPLSVLAGHGVVESVDTSMLTSRSRGLEKQRSLREADGK